MRKRLRKLALPAAIPAVVFLSLAGPALGKEPVPNPQAPPDIAGSINAVKNMAEIDEDMIQRGSAPPILLQYDKQLLALITEGADIWAKHDVVRGHELGAKIDAIMAARNEAQKPYEAASAERAHEAAVRAAEAGASADFERCTDWGGRNICGSAPSSGSAESSDDERRREEWQEDQDYQRQQQINGNLPQ